MKNLIFGLILITLAGCNQKKSTNYNQNAENGSNSVENDLPSTNNDLPMCNYFEVAKINTMKYTNDGKFEMDFELANNTDYLFSSVSLSAYFSLRLKNAENNVIINVPQVMWSFYNLKDSEFSFNTIKKWQPHTSKHIHFTYYIKSSDVSFDRTPDEIELVLEAGAISVDIEKEGAFAKYNLLDLWKKEQVEKGLR